MQPLARDGFTAEQVKAAIHMAGGSRKIDFRYELLDKNDNVIGDLNNVIDAEISMDSLASIKRTAKFRLKDDGSINFLSDRIRPYLRLYVPPGRLLGRYYYFFQSSFSAEFDLRVAPEKGGWVEFPLGIFLLSSPTRKDSNQNIYRDVEAYDGLLILRDDKFDTRYTVRAGTNYRQAVIDILASAGITKHNIEQTDKVLPVDMEFEPGKEKLEAINALLTAINYTPIHVDVYGYFTSMTYRSPSIRSAEYTYKDDELSIIYAGMEEELDLFNVPNKWVVLCSNAEQSLMSSYTNSNPNSPTSTVNRGRTIVDYREVTDIADQQSLDAYVQRIAFEASQVYGKLTFETALNPLHDYMDVLEIDYSPLGIKGKYVETGWTMPLKAGARMKHEVRKVVAI
ncbi:hypothetical protein T260_15150 [Geobacillus thermopakistaniensis]|uniref:Uncharacterized protein n=1 Tax=Geobacillus thermopakistaniensis (strain MAS1) TaxID=1408282 RepID=A0A7U9J919_GEOTM|nr:hypothetical protein [Geobacillus sp. MAS1]ESU71179.1 hypothetical protein T260_15150 [Geobacillus sp. MAS1]